MCWVGHSQPVYWFTIRDVFSLVINVFILLSSNATHTKVQDFKGNLKTSNHSSLGGVGAAETRMTLTKFVMIIYILQHPKAMYTKLRVTSKTAAM